MRISDWSSDVCSSDLVETSGNSPAWLLDKLKNAGCTVIHKVPAIRYALSAERLGVDAITVISGEAGGHTGQYMNGQIVQGPLAADAPKCPLVLGGGMGDGRHLISRSEEHTSEIQSLMRISYAVFFLKKKNNKQNQIKWKRTKKKKKIKIGK